MKKREATDAVREHVSAIRQYLESGHSALHADALRAELIDIIQSYEIDEDNFWNALWLGDRTVFESLLSSHGEEAFVLDEDIGYHKFWDNIQNIPAKSGLRARALEAFIKANPTHRGVCHGRAATSLKRAFWMDDPEMVDLLLNHYDYPIEALAHIVSDTDFFTHTNEAAGQRVKILKHLHKEGVTLSNLIGEREMLILASLGIPFGDAYQDGDTENNIFARAFRSNHKRLRAMPLLPSAEEIFSMRQTKILQLIADICEKIK